MTHRLVTALAAPAALGIALALTTVAGAQTTAPQQNTTMSKPGSALSTDTFVKTAAMSNLFEIESSKVAQQKGRSEEVKRFAQDMITDHTKATQEFQAALQQAGLQMPAPQLDTQHKAMVDGISRSSNVDGEYLQAQVKAHQDAVQMFQSYANLGDNTTMKQFASTTLPTLQKHLQEVEQLSRTATRKTTSR